MDLAEALAVLGLPAGTPMQEVREAYRVQVRASHPDLVGPGGDRSAATARTARITTAFAVVRRAVLEAGTDLVPEPPEPEPVPEPTTGPPGPRPWEVDRVEADTDGDTIAIAA